MRWRKPVNITYARSMVSCRVTSMHTSALGAPGPPLRQLLVIQYRSDTLSEIGLPSL